MRDEVHLMEVGQESGPIRSDDAEELDPDRALDDQAEPRNRTLGDPTTWPETHGDLLFRFALRRCDDPELAADFVQETFLLALRAQDSFRGESAELTWLTGILRHRLADHYRSRARRPENVSLDAISEAAFDEEGWWAREPAEWDAPDQALLRDEFWVTLRDCLSDLPPHLARTFALRELESQSGPSICKTLRISESNLWTRLHRARTMLRDCLERHWFQRFDRSEATP